LHKCRADSNSDYDKELCDVLKKSKPEAIILNAGRRRRNVDV